MNRKLTPKQEGFCYSYIETGNASEAYRLNYDVSNMKDATVVNAAYKLLQKGGIRARLEDLQTEHRERHNITIDSLTAMYLADREAARGVDQYSSAIAAVTGLAKLHGLITDKQKVDVSGKLDVVARLQKGREYARRS